MSPFCVKLLLRQLPAERKRETEIQMGLDLDRNYEIYVVKHFTGTKAVSHLGHSSLQLSLDFMDD